ncbi:TRAP transporter large permease subunit [Neomoorella thermoacetica]|uniref:TRAP transporter large permease subunit n=1 Tax=Neomoorella thermoacetica TaxID=1525 RepID=UPI0008FAE4FA|nr:TRAP transporter large permease subunit [Moorella thermoacetica]OIQ61625.1 sialic acid TRAP transporter permease protein SiaT [Moorella thermoacetica]
MPVQTVGPFPIQVFWLIELLIVIALVFIAFKRPIYEAMAIAFAFTIVMTGRYDLFWPGLLAPTTSGLFYIIVGFLVFAYILGQTRVVEKLINIILAFIGGLPGGAGYVSLFGSSALATMTGTGPGNVAATGVFTIPAMIRSGFPRHLAATVEMAASMLGNQVGPGLNLVAFAILSTLYPDKYSLSTFWLGLYIVFGWLILQRWLTLLAFCKYYRVQPVPKEERPNLAQALKEGWSALLIPVFILGPIIIDSVFKTTLIARYGPDGAKAFSASVLLMAAGFCTFYAIIVGRKEIPGGFNLNSVFAMFRDSLKGVVPVSATIYLAYAIALVFQKVEMSEAIKTWFLSFGLGKAGWALLIVVFTAFLGMVLPGSSQVAILGSAIISTGAAVGLDPFLVAVVMPAITGVMEGMTPPLALAMYTAMGIARSKFWETAKLTYVWVFAHLIVTFLLLIGVLPIFIK